MGDFFQSWVELTWQMLYESSFLLLIGFVLAGIIRAIITPQNLSRLFGRGRLTQIFTSSVVGVPLPLCSCSVLPVAAQLKRSGLSRAGTVSFLISTPETGADSIALSVRLLGPVFAAVRPIAALITALAAGLVTGLLNPDNPGSAQISMAVAEEKGAGSLPARLWQGQVYVMTDMLPELAYYLFWGYVLAGLAAALIPTDLLQSGLPIWLQYLGVIVVSLPVYVCATSSTPLAAVLLSLGLMPGAVLTFLLVGPATNLTSLVVQKAILGLRGTVIMTLSVVVSAVGCGVVMDAVAGKAVAASFSGLSSGAAEGGLAWYDLAAAILLAIIMAYHTAKHYYKKARKYLNR